MIWGVVSNQVFIDSSYRRRPVSSLVAPGFRYRIKSGMTFLRRNDEIAL